uniref:Uncharacterized protein n=1 Tax=Anguilla anguilla TaxID=7936 RepID=A0A0E9P5S1_ANGAN
MSVYMIENFTDILDEGQCFIKQILSQGLIFVGVLFVNSNT